ncbi:hypothetical protein BDZ45DRAFT_124875 [Acephala macrosclerotiorum]|nr:hypothetical protein BDZ45DRAFT_124875 [Acephala macrosclerotiorum]
MSSFKDQEMVFRIESCSFKMSLESPNRSYLLAQPRSDHIFSRIKVRHCFSFYMSLQHVILSRRERRITVRASYPLRVYALLCFYLSISSDIIFLFALVFSINNNSVIGYYHCDHFRSSRNAHQFLGSSSRLPHASLHD